LLEQCWSWGAELDEASLQGVARPQLLQEDHLLRAPWGTEPGAASDQQLRSLGIQDSTGHISKERIGMDGNGWEWMAVAKNQHILNKRRQQHRGRDEDSKWFR